MKKSVPHLLLVRVRPADKGVGGPFVRSGVLHLPTGTPYAALSAARSSLNFSARNLRWLSQERKCRNALRVFPVGYWARISRAMRTVRRLQWEALPTRAPLRRALMCRAILRARSASGSFRFISFLPQECTDWRNKSIFGAGGNLMPFASDSQLHPVIGAL